MSDIVTKTLESLHAEYSQLCARAGHLSYQIHAHGKELADVNAKLEALNLEASALKAKAPEAAADAKV